MSHLKTVTEYKNGDIDYCWLSDTFIMFTNDDSSYSYSLIECSAKYFLQKCIYSGIPIRGAISVGNFVRSEDNRALMGDAFIDAFEYGEDQNWLGLLLTPKAIKKARLLELEPLRHDFISSKKIPMRKKTDQVVLAYKFQNGESTFSSPLIPHLIEMKKASDDIYHEKYDNTIDFIG